MVKARATKDGKPLFIYGLSEENIKRLKAGRPIFFSNEEVGAEGHTMIIYGETEEAIADELGKHFVLPS